jgi:pimeloyl-ACP methyl ester carboxylesterase
MSRGKKRKDCMVLVHGLGRFKTSMQKLGTALAHSGYDVVNWAYPSLLIDITTAADQLNETVRVNAELHEQIHFVTHSLGGIVVRRMLKRSSADKVGAIVMLAPPNRGSALARYLVKNPFFQVVLGPTGAELADATHLEETCAIPASGVCVISGTRHDDWRNPAHVFSSGKLELPNDGTVSVEETCLPLVERHALVHASHTRISSHEDVIAQALAFIRSKSQSGAAPRPDPPGTLPSQLGHDPWLEGLPAMPNVECATAGGRVWWRDVANLGNWRLQQNILWGNCRILDPADRRKAWGGTRAIVQEFKRIVGEVGLTPIPGAAPADAPVAGRVRIDPSDMPILIGEFAESRDKRGHPE